MRLESVSEYLSRGGRVYRCRPGEFGLSINDPGDGMNEARARGGAATASQRAKYLPGPGVELGKRVRAVRLRKGLTFAQIGNALGRTDAWVRMLEQGDISLTRSQDHCRKTADRIEEWLRKYGG